VGVRACYGEAVLLMRDLGQTACPLRGYALFSDAAISLMSTRRPCAVLPMPVPLAQSFCSTTAFGELGGEA